MDELVLFIEKLSAGMLFLAALITLMTIIRYRQIAISLVALEVLAYILIASIAFWALIYEQIVLIDACLALALVMFLATVGYCTFLMRKPS